LGSAATPFDTAPAHNARHQRALDAGRFSASVPKGIAGNCEFVAKFCEDGGLKNRYRHARKSWILQVLISRTLSVYGEVAERLKAAVC